MGRTVPTYRYTIESIIDAWRNFRRALRPEEREAFDSMMQHAREHAAAGSACAAHDPVEPVLLSILLEHEMEISALREELRKR
jgi:hypothetical protein